VPVRAGGAETDLTDRSQHHHERPAQRTLMRICALLIHEAEQAGRWPDNQQNMRNSSDSR